ncbi:MAG: hypothetical protein GX437_02570 [Sphingobacteriales bacterium]|nr:hypothetical protein [Sphingobacteriales bacterium]
MVKTAVRYTFWHWFGLISAFIFLIAISILIYNYLQQRQSFSLKANIEVYPFSPPPNIDFSVPPDKESELMMKIKDNLPLKEPTNENAKALYKAISYDFLKLYADFIKKYHTYYEITLINNGDETAIDINIDLKSKGKYLIDYEKGDIEFEDFQNHITIDELIPGEEITLLVWSEIILKDYTNYQPKSIDIYCKQGNAKITWPVKVEGIAAWNAINNNYPLIFAVSIFLVVVVVLMIVFFNLGCRKNTDSPEKEEVS